MNHVKTELDGFVRDLSSKAIINTNVEHIKKFKQEREERLKLQAVTSQQQQLATEVDNIKRDLNDIKSLLLDISKRL